MLYISGKNAKQVKASDRELLDLLFESWSGERIIRFEPLPMAGSYREYYRLIGKSRTAIGVYNEDIKENKAFLTFSKHFRQKGLNVPDILKEDDSGKIYLISDLGDQTLFKYLEQKRESAGIFPGSGIAMYKKVLTDLPKFQITAASGLDYSVCYPRSAFDKQSMMWDLNYFKYYFLKLAKIPFDEQLLENDYQTFSDFLLTADSDYFLYRDFQSRNIMVMDDQPWFIDYQGGRKGALQYDVASLLYDSKANIPADTKMELLDHYIGILREYISFDTKQFIRFYRGFVLIRLMQAMGAYGFRGFYERKTQFLKSIPYALKQLGYIMDHYEFPVDTPHLKDVLGRLMDSEELKKFNIDFNTGVPLNIDICSFSYRKGIPENKYGDGGGFVFDCRCIHNPGRYERYVHMTGKDPEVQDFLRTGGEADAFLHNIYMVVEQAIDKYLNREFKNLQISFGCTGGQHRSVYCAEQMSEYLTEKYEQKIRIQLNHREQK